MYTSKYWIVSTVNPVHSETCVIRFPVLTDIDFHALLTIFDDLHYVIRHSVYSLRLNRFLCIIKNFYLNWYSQEVIRKLDKCQKFQLLRNILTYPVIGIDALAGITRGPDVIIWVISFLIFTPDKPLALSRSVIRDEVHDKVNLIIIRYNK